MGVRVECDWCRQVIAPGEPYVTIEIDGKIIRGARGNSPEDVSQPARVYCGLDRYTDDDPAARALGFGSRDDGGWGHREGCARRVLSVLEGNPAGRADCGMEWRLVAQAAPSPDRLLDAPVAVLEVSKRTLKALENAGVGGVRDLASMNEAQWLAIKGIATGGVREIRAALHRHEHVDAKELAAEMAS